jgi:hypothetical protein
MITTESCPKFNKCSSNICPLDDSWSKRVHLHGEPICFYCREYVKQGGIARLRSYIPIEMIELIAEVLPEINKRYVDIKRRLERAGTTGSKIESCSNFVSKTSEPVGT